MIAHISKDEVSSTNDIAKKELESINKVFVTANFQTAGRGRNKNTWQGNNKENIYASMGINHSPSDYPPIEQIVIFQALGCLAAKRAIIETTGFEALKIKYPNDLYALNGTVQSKICGVLAEHTFMGSSCVSSIIGIGINVNQTTFDDNITNNPTSLKLLGIDSDIEALRNSLSKHLITMQDYDIDLLFDLWNQELNLDGKQVSIIGSDEQWTIKEMLNDGRLQARNSAGIIKYIDNGDSIRYEL